MRYPYLNIELNKTFEVDFPEGYAIKLAGKVEKNDLVLNVKDNRFTEISNNDGSFMVSDFYIVVTPFEKVNIIPFRNQIKKENQQLELAVA